MKNKERIDQIEKVFKAGMPLSIASKIAFDIFADTDASKEEAEYQIMWLLQCVLAQGRKDGRIRAKDEILKAIAEL